MDVTTTVIEMIMSVHLSELLHQIHGCTIIVARLLSETYTALDLLQGFRCGAHPRIVTWQSVSPILRHLRQLARSGASSSAANL